MPGDCRDSVLNVQRCPVWAIFGHSDVWISAGFEHKMRFPAFQQVKRESSTRLELTRSGMECRGERFADTVSGREVFHHLMIPSPKTCRYYAALRTIIACYRSYACGILQDFLDACSK